MKLAREARPQVILCDMKMPHMAGTDVLRALAADPTTAHIPRVLMTGNIDADRSAAHGFLLKPFLEADLVAVLERVANNPARRQSLRLACEV